MKESKARARMRSTSSDPRAKVSDPPNISHNPFAEGSEPDDARDVEGDLQNRDGQ